MKVAKLLQNRESNWAELEQLCGKVRKFGAKSDPEVANRFSMLYRAVCADLALADAYQLPPQKVEYLQSLVARAHNTLYQNKRYQFETWAYVIFNLTPRLIFSDRCVHLAFMIWLVFSGIASVLAYDDSLWPGFAEQTLGTSQMQGMEDSFGDFGGRSWAENVQMAGYYIVNNAGIGMRCFASGILIVPGLFILVQNAIQIGAAFGFMFRPEMGVAGANFRDFVTVHGPYEITAIILSAGAGLRIGVSWLTTQRWTRLSALILAGRRAMPIALAAVILFVLAAFLEGFVSPFPRTVIPWPIKGALSVICSASLLFYFVVLGYPGIDRNAEIDADFQVLADQSDDEDSNSDGGQP